MKQGSDRKKVEHDLVLSLGSYRVLFEKNPQPMWVYDIETLRFLAVNHAATLSYGYSSEEFLQMTISDIRPGEQRSKLLSHLFVNSLGEYRRPGVWKHLKKDGTVIDADITTHDLTFNGRKARLVIALDVTDQKRQEEALLMQARLIESMAEGAVVTDTDGLIVYANPAFDAMMGYDRGELKGKHVSILNNETPQNELLLDAMVRSLLAEGAWSGEIENRKKDGTIFYTYARMSTLEVSGRKNWISVQVDITERKSIERLKDEMISAVSHEMRTPLTAIKGYIEHILESPFDEVTTREYLEIVHKATERLDELIGKFLDMQRFKAKQDLRDFRPIPVVPLLQEVATLFASASGEHRITVDVIADVPPVYGNEDDLHSVLNNLLSNAIKYSPNGGTVILGGRPEGSKVTLWVKDEGIGISQNELERVFDRFYRIDNTARRKTAGTGLGLALVKQIVLAHGGETWVESVAGKGSTFYVSLPCA